MSGTQVDYAWRTHRRWSLVTGRLDTFLVRWRTVNLSLFLLGSVLGALASQQNWFSKEVTLTLGAVSAGVLAVAGIIQARLLTPARLHERIQARALSEAYKGIVFQYLAAVAPFASDDRDRQLRAKINEIAERAHEDGSLIMGVAPDGRQLPEVRGIDDYVKQRAVEQRNWHEGKTSLHRSRAARWRAAELIATAVAAVLAAVGGALHGPDLSAWVAVATTAAAAFAAHLAGQQYQRIADSYARTVMDLDTLLRDFDPTSATADEAAAFVAGVESVLAAQNNIWVSLFSAC